MQKLRAYFVLIYLFCCSVQLFSQNENTKWYFGYYAALDFMTNPPTILGNSNMPGYAYCTSSIADAAGNLLFYTNGNTVWNSQHSIMANGTGLYGGVYTQSSIIIKQPGSATIYYIFTLRPNVSPQFNYSIVDMSLAAGMGSVTVKNSPIYGASNCIDKLHATKHANGADYWVMIHEAYNSNFRAYQFSATGVNTTAVVSSAGVTYTNNNPANYNYFYTGQMKFSPNGQKLGAAWYSPYNYTNQNQNVDTLAELFDFNKNTGVVSNPVILTVPTFTYNNGSTNYYYNYGGYGCEFSSDGSKFYCDRWNNYSNAAQTNSQNVVVAQWNVNAGSPSAIQASSVAVQTYTYYNNNNCGYYNYFGAMQLAPNKKIYIANYTYYGNTCNNNNNSISYIDNPNGLGTACNFSLWAQPIGTTNSNAAATYNYQTWCYYGLPNMIAQPCTLTFTAQSNNMTCGNGNTGSGSVMSVSGASGTVTYSWTNGTTSYSTTQVNNLSAGSWSIILSDTIGCASYSVFNISQSPSITISVSANSPSACVGNSVVLTATASGGVGGFTYNWSGTAGSSYTASQANSGSYVYTATATAANFCSLSNTVSVDFIPNPTLTPIANQSICPNTSATLITSGANTYTWQPSGVFTNSVVVTPTLPVTIYTVTGTTTAGCVSSTTTQISVWQAPVLSFNTYSITCANLGSATVTASGGIGPYTYTWMPTSQTTSIVTGLNPNTYTLTVGDAGTGCISTITQQFLPLVPLTGQLNHTSSLTCNSVPTGSANFTNLANGSGNENYTWTNGTSSFTNQNPTTLGAGTWTVSVADALTGCSIYSVFTITQPPALTLNVASSSQSICLSYDVTLTANALGGVGGFSYAWGASSGNVYTTSPGASGIHVYTATVNDANNCSLSNTILVNVVPLPNLILSSSSSSMCAQSINGSPNVITLTASGANTYTLNTPSHVFNSNPSGPSSQVSMNAPYQLIGLTTATLYGSNGVCTLSTTTNFSIVPNPTVIINSSTPAICKGQNFTYVVSGASSYTWSSSIPNSILYTTGNSAVANPTTNSIFSVIGEKSGCFSATQESTLTVNPIPEVHVTPNPTFVCLNSVITITAQGTAGNLYTWYPSLNTGNQLYVQANDLQTKTYTVLASLNNCTNAATATVSVKPLPTAGLAILKQGKCVNDSIVIKGSGGMVYYWQLPNGYNYYGQELHVKANNENYMGIYALTVYDANYCSDTKTQFIQINPLPSGYVKGQNMQGCVPLCNDLSFVPITQSSITSLTWQMNNRNFSGNSVYYCFNQAGEFTIQINLRDQNNCLNIISTQVSVYPQPTADFYFTPQEPVENLETVSFINTSKAAQKFDWEFSIVNQSSTETNPELLFENTGTYAVALIAQSDKNCLDTVVKTIYVKPDFAVYVPNIFTPNGDNLNETFKPVMRGQFEFRFSVYNRWGTKLFETTDINRGWDGTFQGKECEEGVYVWKLVVSNSKEERKSNGTVTLQK